MKIAPVPAINRREMRALSLASTMVRALDDYIPRDCRSAAHDALTKLFHDADAEVITNEDRRAAGLSERNEFGLSPEEHRLIESQRAFLMTQPPPPIMFCMTCPHKPGSATESGARDDAKEST